MDVVTPSPFEVCRGCEFRHTYCHASCEIYHDIVRLKTREKEARRGSPAEQYERAAVAAAKGRQA